MEKWTALVRVTISVERHHDQGSLMKAITGVFLTILEGEYMLIMMGNIAEAGRQVWC